MYFLIQFKIYNNLGTIFKIWQFCAFFVGLLSKIKKLKYFSSLISSSFVILLIKVLGEIECVSSN
jgi:hypothetical protein